MHPKAYAYLKPEVLCAELMNNGITVEQLTVHYIGAFKKAFRPEIENVDVQLDEQSDPIFNIVLNRDGIYDRLPEGLFHQPKGNKRTSSVQDMVDEYRRLRNEEKQARKFFRPFEQEFLHFGSLLQAKEQELSFSLLNGDFSNELYAFWGISTALSDDMKRKLLPIMPWINYVKGDLQMSANCLSYLLDKKVTASAVHITKQQVEEELYRLGESGLGEYTLLGQEFIEPSLCWKFIIHEISKADMAGFVNGQAFHLLLNEFAELFIPLYVDIEFEFEMKNKVEQDITEDILGYSLVI